MNRIARIERDNDVEIVRVKKNADSFTDKKGNRYNVGTWKIRPGWLWPVMEATYFPGVPNPVLVREIELPTAEKIQRVKIAHPDSFTGVDYEKLHGDPIIRWLTVAMQRAAGGMMLQYVTCAASVVAALTGVYIAVHLFNHPWR